VGDPVATLTFGGFAEYAVQPVHHVLRVPEATAAAVALLTSGLTASIALEQARLARGETVLVTAAAGGTGSLAVQLAKRAGCHVIGTCGSADKAAQLRRLGVDRVVSYKREDLANVRAPLYAARCAPSPWRDCAW
jgi:prostaglandin reductase 3